MTKLPETIGEAVARGTRLLAENAGAAVESGAVAKAGAAVESGAAIEARALLLDCLGFDDYGEILAKSGETAPPAALARYEEHLRQRKAGHPVAYILGWREFYGRRFRTTPAALIPRPETEHLVAAALWHLPPGGKARVLDLGAGCGAIGISIALERPQSQIQMTDVDEQALLLAKQNAGNHNIHNATFRRADWYEAVKDEAPMDMIISNPPYVADDDGHLHRGDLRFEPPLALRGGADGLAALTRVIGEAPKHLRRGGLLLVEHGFGQADKLQMLFAAAGFCGLSRRRDYADLERVMLGALP